MTELKTVGQSVIRKDVWDKVTGEATYADDASLPTMLHMKMVFAETPHARIRKLETAAAENHPGVVAIFTAKDLPSNVMGMVTQDQQVFCDEKVRFEGDQVCAIVAETAAQANAAAKLVQIEYDDLPVLDSPFQAMESGAALIHEDKPGNLCHQVRLRVGDADAALAEADVVIEREYFTPWQEHAYLEPEAGLAYIDDEGRVTVRASGQNTHDDLRQICAALDLPEDQVRVVYGAIGGAFGGREDVSVQIALALAAWKLQRPVKIRWSREESIKGHGKRHPITIRHKWGARSDGTLLAAKTEVITDAGAYNSTSSEVLTNFYYAAIGAYQIPNVSMDGFSAFTNNVPGCAFRGFGSPQATFAAELQIEHIAEALNLDPVTIRLKNCVRDGATIATQSEIPPGVSLPALIEACANELGAEQKGNGWEMPIVESEKPHKRRGIGMAAGMKNSGFGWGFPEGSEARVVLHGQADIERVELFTAAADCGQGAHNVLAQVAAEALNVPLEVVETVTSDTATIGDAGPASASRLTIFAGQAVKQAADQALEKWHNEDRPAVGGGRWDAPLTTPPDPETGACFNSITYAYGVQAVEIEVDMETGEIEILNIVAAHDPGRAVNPQQVIGQLQGGIIQAQGWALTENFLSQGGYVQTDRLSTYLIPTSLDAVSEIKFVLLEQPDTIGPYGVRGVGEIGILLLAPALVSALHDATGVWFDRIPLTPERVISGLQTA
ncbi:MAG: xanthine dehydrogenase family protein molybdopterin-binding subunit [Chloroflexi bacterium]|nr:MAG: xanthine dehydrogenase family protein molybdopterin-binding subunit [Chloroflexota bacterium]MBL1197192.1 xanthine dehydrogenase family protein molybdopterin-binding subunit [Chloroflexota bacterium]NOH14486.1 xanthine dehydrogenase family protein molybdopterin-binding subunit [Chloroflexota bacterium]